MPGFDRSGPMGMGPMTGGARGRCNPSGRTIRREGYMQGFAGRGDRNQGLGRRRGFGRGTSRNQAPYSEAYTTDTGNELDLLKTEADSAMTTLESIKKRIAELEKTPG